MTNLEGQTFAGYEVLSKLGEGGMGAVYKARQPMLNRLVALKVMSPHLGADPSFVARFVREASAAANLNHPNMVQVYTAGEADGMHFIAMEFVEGESLQKRLSRLGRIEPREAIAIAVYVAQALQYAWNKAYLIHRDIKPDNVFLSNSGEVKVGDLGLAKSVGGETTELTQTGTAMGSPHYISPEQATGLKEVDFRTDIYSLGCTLYHMLTGKTPYSGDSSMAVMMKHVNDPPPAIFKTWPGCPMPMGMLVGKMLAKDRSARPQSYEQLVDDLLAVHEKIKNIESVRAVAVTPAAPQPKSVTPATGAKVARSSASASVEKTVARRPSGKPKSRKAIYVAAGAAAVVALGGLLLWSPWKANETGSGSGSAGILPATSEPKSDTAGRMPALPVETIAAPPKSSSPQAETAATREAAPAPPKFGTLFDGRDASAWQQRDGGPCDWQVEAGALVAGATDLDTREKFQDFQLHIEFACPNDAKQGNSGVYMQGRYELQILESFGKSATDTSCGSIFKLKAPTENASKPPDEWQTFDITFHAARFDAAGAKTANARVSVIHNGRLIHDNVEIPKSSGKGDGESATPGPIRLQAYNSPVRFRNISIKPVTPEPARPSQPSVAPSTSVAWQNLIPLVDPQRDATGGEWKIVNGELVCARAKGWSMCEIPVNYRGGNYDLRIRVTRGEGMQIGMFFPFRKGSAGGDVIFDYRTPRHLDDLKRAGLEKRRGHSLDDPDLTVTRTQWIPKGHKATILLQVRDDYLAAQLDGKEVFRWTADWSQLQQGVGFDKELFKRFDGRPIFGVGIFNCQATYHAIEMREVSDQGPFTRNIPASSSASPSAAPGSAQSQRLQWFGYSVCDKPSAVQEIAPYTNFILLKDWEKNANADEMIGAARKVGLKVVLRLPPQTWAEMENTVRPFIAKHRDVIVAACWGVTYHFSDWTPETLAENSRRLKQVCPQLPCWAEFVEEPRGKVDTLPIPPEVDVILANFYYDTQPGSLLRKANLTLAGWMSKANGRPVLLQWISQNIPKTTPDTMRTCAEVVRKFGCAGLCFHSYDDSTNAKGSRKPGIASNPTLVNEIKAIAEESGFAK